MALPLDKLFLIASVPMAIGFLAALGLVWLCYLRFGNLQLDDVPAGTVPEPAPRRRRERARSDRRRGFSRGR